MSEAKHTPGPWRVGKGGPAEVSPDELIEIDGMLVLPFKAKK